MIDRTAMRAVLRSTVLILCTVGLGLACTNDAPSTQAPPAPSTVVDPTNATRSRTESPDTTVNEALLQKIAADQRNENLARLAAVGWVDEWNQRVKEDLARKARR